MRNRIYLIWEQLVIRYILVTGRGKRSREWRHYVRSEAARKGHVTRRLRMGTATEFSTDDAADVG